MQAIARKGLGSGASATEENDLDDLSEKMREKVSMLCADMLDDVEGPLRRETELVQHLLELTQDPDPAQYQHGGRVLKLIVSGYSLTDDSTEMVQISKMKHGALMRMKFEKASTTCNFRCSVNCGDVLCGFNCGFNYRS